MEKTLVLYALETHGVILNGKVTGVTIQNCGHKMQRILLDSLKQKMEYSGCHLKTGTNILLT